MVGIPQTTIASYESGARNPRPKIAKQIHARTGGEIPVHDLRPDIYGIVHAAKPPESHSEAAA